jgi:hypothetical protein
MRFRDVTEPECRRKIAELAGRMRDALDLDAVAGEAALGSTNVEPDHADAGPRSTVAGPFFAPSTDRPKQPTQPKRHDKRPTPGSGIWSSRPRPPSPPSTSQQPSTTSPSFLPPPRGFHRRTRKPTSARCGSH